MISLKMAWPLSTWSNVQTQGDMSFVCDVLQLWKFITVGGGVWIMCNVMKIGIYIVQCSQ